MRLILPTLAALSLMAGTAFAIASDADLEALAAQISADEQAFDAERDRVDDLIRNDTRRLVNNLLIPAASCPTVAACQAAIVNARLELARPGPADSAAKRIHTATRQLGSQGIQALRRAQARVEGLIE